LMIAGVPYLSIALVTASNTGAVSIMNLIEKSDKLKICRFFNKFIVYLIIPNLPRSDCTSRLSLSNTYDSYPFLYTLCLTPIPDLADISTYSVVDTGILCVLYRILINSASDIHTMNILEKSKH